ncbi:hypothetical protein ABMA84_15715 [Halobacteriovorax sp. XZX-2]|uniref:hypothetical protein n=1 Tax=unclassified Halobacteriovorax TaxID=2639665 RepID=UPI00371E6288
MRTNNNHYATGSRKQNFGKRKPKNANRMFFDPMVYVLDIIRKHFDEKAFLTHNQKYGHRIIKYRHTTGKRLVLGTPANSRLVYDFAFAEMDEEACEKLCLELGQVK